MITYIEWILTIGDMSDVWMCEIRCTRICHIRFIQKSIGVLGWHYSKCFTNIIHMIAQSGTDGHHTFIFISGNREHSNCEIVRTSVHHYSIKLEILKFDNNENMTSRFFYFRSYWWVIRPEIKNSDLLQSCRRPSCIILWNFKSISLIMAAL